MKPLGVKSLYGAILAVLPLGALAAWQLGGARAPQAVGAFTGCALACGVSLAACVAQERLSRRNSALAMQVTLLAFLAKLFVLLGGALTLRFVPALGERADWGAYLLGFAAAVLWVTGCVAVAHWLRLTRNPRAIGAEKPVRERTVA